ncbi:major facilitator superfamily domain-containing protein [Aspergillus undulatus]|uniref:major facilitator superfamily domain-containing protein n=1 Tax=Aspergillus undulatus TaxID=1810928 RepID=UPI003CCDF7E2
MPFYRDSEPSSPRFAPLAETAETAPLNRSADLDPSSAYKLNANVLNRAIQEIGMGHYQWRLFWVVGFGWACDNLWPIVTSLILLPVTYEFDVSQSPLLLLAQNIGLLAGALFWGFGCDIFGRRIAFNMTIGITAVFSLATTFAPSFGWVCVLAALWSIGVGGNLPVDSAIFLEFLPGSHQYLLTLLSVNWAAAQFLANLVAWGLVGNFTCPSADGCTRANNLGWRYFVASMGGMALLMSITRYFLFSLLESPKYLMGKGEYYKAVSVVHEVAKRNGTSCSLTTDELHDCDNSRNGHERLGDYQHRRGLSLNDRLRMFLEPFSSTQLKSLFSGPRRFRATTLLINIWGFVGIAFPLYNAFLPYLQQQRGIEFGDGSTYITYRNSLIIAIASIPGSLVGSKMVDMALFGRKGTLTLATLLTGVFLLASTTATTSSAFSSLVYAVLYAYTPEIFESRNRGTGNALTSAANRLGGIMAPLIAMGSNLQSTVPVYVSGIMFMLAGVLVIFVPYESRGKTSMPALYLEASPTMTFAYDHEAEFWGALINPDKSPSPLLEQLCLGIAHVMTTFDNYAIPDLTAERLAAFYRKVGGNYDVLFLDTKPSALSFIYQRLGCFHSIQPSADPYKPPSIPALQPHGFVRWQTIQLLLDPDEHVSYLQNAVERWDIFSPNGTLFPKTIPREAFPAEPDPEMIQWHETVSQKFEFDYWKKNLPTTGTYHQRDTSASSSKEDDFVHVHHPRPSASNYRYSVPADPHTSRRHQRRQSDGVPPNSHKSQTSVPRRSAELASGYTSPRAPSPPTWPKHAPTSSTKSRGRERKTYSRPVSPEQLHAHSSSDASSEGSGTATQSLDPGSPPPRYAHHHRNLSPPHAPHPRRHSHEAYSRRPHRDLSPDTARRYAYRAHSDAFSPSNMNRPYDSDSGRPPRQPRVYIDEVRQSRTPNPGPTSYREPVFGESATAPTSPLYGHAHSVHPIPVHPRFVNVNNPAYMVHPHSHSHTHPQAPQPDLDASVMDDRPRNGYRVVHPHAQPHPQMPQPDLDANLMDDPRRNGYRGSPAYMVPPHSHSHSHHAAPAPAPDFDSSVMMDDPRGGTYRGGSVTPNPVGSASASSSANASASASGGAPYGRPRFASVGEFQPPRQAWAGMGVHGHSGRMVPPGIIQAEYGGGGRRASMYDR